MKKYKWLLYADNNIEKEIVEHLRQSGMDVLWIAEEPDLQRQQEDGFHYHEAAKQKRYYLTHDGDFWDDNKHPLNASPGTIILSAADISEAKYMPVLLRKLILDYNTLEEPLYLDGIKIKLSAESITIKMVDRDTQQKTVETWRWSELY